jgi:hypothetical protein
LAASPALLTTKIFLCSLTLRLPILTYVETDLEDAFPTGKVRLLFSLHVVPEERVPEAERFLADLIVKWGGGTINYVSHKVPAKYLVSITGFVDVCRIGQEVGNDTFYLMWSSRS